MANVNNLLDTKGNAVWSVQTTTTVEQALQLMADKNIGAVLVMEGDQIVGIYSERDYARQAAEADSLLLDRPVSNYMTHSVYFVSPRQTVEECMALMTSRHIRHLPVLEGETRLVGLISIGDVVKQLLAEKENAIQDLENYIQGRAYSG